MKKIFHSLLSAAILATVVFYLPACTGAQHGKESVEEVASYTQADYFTTDSEKQIINASNQFSLRLFKELAASNKGKDLFFSPLGVVSTLEILSNGTDGQTLKQLQQTLGTSRFQLDDINALNRKMMIAHAKVEEDQFTGTKSAYMKSSHLFLYQKKHIINPDFIQTITHSYFADSHAFDTPENAQQIVDSCCKENTRGTINHIPLKIEENVDVFLFNTLLFNASWLQEFNTAKPDTFHITNDRIKMVDMMTKTDEEECFKYMQNDEFSMLQIPYVGPFGMYVLLPQSEMTVDSLLKNLTMEKLSQSMEKLKEYDIVEVSLPKIHLKSEQDFKQPLINMGLDLLFSDEANFNTMDKVPIKINGMTQKTEVMVDEKGTHIEAITSTSFVTLSEILSPTKAVFHANRPFVYFIRDSYGSICFAGIYRGEE